MGSQEQDNQAQDRTFVAGGGPAGLIAAYKLMKAGKRVVIGEAQAEQAGRFGKVESGMLDGEVVNYGAEFIDSKHMELRTIAKELGVNLVKADDQEAEIYQKPDGSVIPAKTLLATLQPIAKTLEADKAGNDPAIDNMTLPEYLNYKNHQLDEQHIKSKGLIGGLFARIFSPKSPDHIPQDVIDTVAHAYGSEAGQDPNQISARQFLNEMNPDLNPQSGSLFNSDAAYRVEGGTAALYEAIKQKLAENGAEFRYNTKLTGVKKDGDQFEASFEKGGAEKFDHMVMAMPMHELAKVHGLDKLGLSDKGYQTLKDGQYTHSAKAFVPIKESIKPEVKEKLNAFFLSADNFQTWQSTPHILTILVGGKAANHEKGRKLVEKSLDRYVKGLNASLGLKGGDKLKVNDLFDVDKAVVRGPDTKSPCYASPSKGQVAQLNELSAEFDAMAQNGIGVVGSYIPARSEEKGSIGFMENAALSAQRAINFLLGRKEPEQSRGTGMEQDVQVEAPSTPSNTHRNRYLASQQQRPGWSL